MVVPVFSSQYLCETKYVPLEFSNIFLFTQKKSSCTKGCSTLCQNFNTLGEILGIH